jgi:hypothetical protein
MRLMLGVLVCLTLACGGSTMKAAVGDAGIDSSEDASMCPPGSIVPTIPDADVYLCEAGPVGSAGCPAASGDPIALYPEGCVKLLPGSGGFCSGPCCGPNTCICQRAPGLDDGGLEFVCPL